VLFTVATLIVFVIIFWYSVSRLFCLWLSVPVQEIDWKDSSPKWIDGDVKPYSLIHSLTLSISRWALGWVRFKVSINALYAFSENSLSNQSFAHLLTIKQPRINTQHKNWPAFDVNSFVLCLCVHISAKFSIVNFTACHCHFIWLVIVNISSLGYVCILTMFLLQVGLPVFRLDAIA